MNDDYEHIDKSVEYILENIPPTERDTSVEFKKLYDAYNSLLQNNCSCANDCSSKLCLHTQNYIKLLNEKILNPTIYERGVIYECTDLCRCDPLICLNRLLQFGPRRNLKIQDFSHIGKNYGLVTLNPIPAGGFICEYAGELLTKSMAAERQNYNEKYKKMNYIICVNEYITTQSDGKDNFKLIQSFIDPSKHGNIGRYINHSCLPNSEILIVRIDNPLPRLGSLYFTNYIYFYFY